MKQKLNVLLIENNSIVEKQLSLELEKRFNPTIRRVETKEEFKLELATKIPDIILSEFKLPLFDCLHALLLRKQIAPLTPFIFLIDNMEEKVVVEIMKNGADDYVNKDRLTRLNFSVSSAIQKSKLLLEKNENEILLQKSKEKYKEISSAVSDYVFSSNINMDGNLVLKWIAGSFEELTGYNLEDYEACGGWRAALHPDDRELDTMDMEKLKLNQRVITEIRTIKKDGSILWVRVYAKPIMNSDCTQLIGINGTVRDISELKLAEKELRESEAMHRIILANIGDVISILGADGVLKYVSPNIEKYFGWRPEDFIGNNTGWEMVYPDDIDSIKREFISLMDYDDASVTVEYREKCKDGSYKWVELTAVNKINDPVINGVLCNNHIITDRKLVEEQLIFRNILLSTQLETSLDGILVVDEDNNTISYNRRFVEMMNIPKELMETGIDGTVLSFVKEQMSDPNLFLLRVQYLYEHKHEISREEIVLKNGKIFDRYSSPIFDTDERFYGRVWYFRDVTESQNAQKALRQSESRYRRLFESAKDGILILDSESGQIIDVNPFLIEMLGYSHEEFMGLELWEIGVFKNIVASKEAFIELQNKGYIRYDDLPLETKGGNRINVEFVSNVYMVDNTRVIQCNIRDITERKMANEKIKSLNEAIEQNPVSIIITNPDGSIEYVNPMFSAVTGYTYEEVLNKNLRFLQSGNNSKNENEQLWKTILSGKVWRGVFHNKKKNGDLYWEDSIISPILRDDGTITHFVAVKEDITEKKKMIDDLIIAKDQAEEMNRLKTSFLNNMSHELRTPLIGILGFSEILKSEIENKEHLEMACQIHEGGVRLSETLNLILDLSRIESEKMSLEIKLYNLSKVTRQRIANYAGAAKLKGISLTTIINDENINVNTDERVFSQILDNLVNNAIKFTDIGGVSVILDKQIKIIKGKSETFAVLKVMDTGIGLAEENYDLIFEEFRQVSEGLGRSFEGSGLGLSITKKFIQKLGGSITVESKLGSGSIFTVSLPAANLLDDNTENNVIGLNPVTKEINDLPKILLVDDDLPTYNISKIFLKNMCVLDHATSGPESIAMTLKNQYQIILMDINLGFGMNGLTALKDIRKVSGYEKIPVVAFTAYATLTDRQYFLGAGCDYYLSKPFQKVELQNLISGILSKSPKVSG